MPISCNEEIQLASLIAAFIESRYAIFNWYDYDL